MKKKGYSAPKGAVKGGVMGHEKMPKKCNAFEAQKSDMGRINRDPRTNRGYPSEAWNYKY